MVARNGQTDRTIDRETEKEREVPRMLREGERKGNLFVMANWLSVVGVWSQYDRIYKICKGGRTFLLAVIIAAARITFFYRDRFGV